MSMISFNNYIVPFEKTESDILFWANLRSLSYCDLKKGNKDATCSFVTWVSKVSSRFWKLSSIEGSIHRLK